MRKLARSSRVLKGIALFVIGAAAVLLLWPNIMRGVFGGAAHDHATAHASGSHSEGFSHGNCYLWEPNLLWLHVLSDTAIGIAYVVISGTLAYLVYRARRDIPFHWMFLAFGVFIIACAGTHFMGVVTVWLPAYWAAGGVKLITAAASVATAIVLPPVVPQVITLLRTAKLSEERKEQLERAHQELETLYAKRQELDQLKSQFFANVSHELRTPLALILGPTQNLLASGGLDEKQSRDLETVQRNAHVLLKHVNDLLDVSKLEAGKMGVHYGEIDLANLVRLTAANFESLAHERQIAFEVATPAALPAQADQEKIQRVVINLLSNAFKFTPNGGAVHCALRRIGNNNENDAPQHAVLEVRDSGPGVAEEVRENIFDRFHQGDAGTTRRFGGTGLGLSITKEFVELHGGHVTVGSAPEGGAAFTLELPLLAPLGTMMHDAPGNAPAAEVEIARQALAQLQPDERQEDGAGPATGSTPALVLVVEDNADMNRFICDTLASQYRVASASDGREGLQKAMELRPDLILCDLMMPQLSGDQLLRAVRAETELAATAFILLTANTDESLRVQLLEEGAQDYLMKPFFVEELRARAANQILLKRARDILQQEVAGHHHTLAELAQEVTLRRHEAEASLAALQQSERLYHDLADAMPQIIWAARPDGYLDYYNQRWFEYTGLSEAQTLSQDGWQPVLHPDDVQLCMDRWYDAVRTGESYEIEYRFKRAADGAYRWHLGRALPTRDEKNQIIRWFGTCTDIDDHKRTLEERAQLLEREQAARREAEDANRGKDEFLAVLSHELRTPLTAMMGWIELLRSGMLDEPTTVEALKTIDRNTKAQVQLVEDILDVSRAVSGKLALELRPLALSPIIEAALSTAQPAAAAKNIELHYESDDAMIQVAGDERRLQQILWNLLANATKFTPNGGRVEVRARQHSDFVEIQVSDTGQGIKAEFLSHVFERFRQADSSSTRAHGGLGLGLAVARHLAELHGGTIEASSPGVGEGSTFTVRLPALREDQGA